MEGDLPMARVLALKSVHAILNSRGANLADLFIALANLLDVSCLLGLFSYCDRILDKGQSILNMRVKNMHNTDFVAEEIAIGKFISTAFKVKLLEGKLVPAFELGKSAEQKAEECEAEAALLWNRCFCILLAIHLKKIDQAVYYLEKLRNEGKEMSYTCYFIFSTYLILYTGLIEESPHRALEEVHRSLIDLERPLAIVLAVFFIRRFYLMMAYIHRIFKAKSLSDLYLTKAESESQRLGDILETEWISHNRMSWSREEDEMFCSWLEHSSRLRHVNWKETESMFYYPLPLPKEPLSVGMNMDVFNPIFDSTFR